MQIKKLQLLTLPLLIFTFSCNSATRLFSEKTAHEKYAEEISDTEEGKQWIAVSKSTLEMPHHIELPYSQVGYFPHNKPKALTLLFTVKQGEKITIDLSKKTDSGFVMYADVFQKKGTATAYIQSADSLQTQFSLTANETSTYLLRLQPELYQKGSYGLSISVAPSLEFPVAGDKAKAGSFWGADRDGGKRRHEGVDIFAPKLTPAIAAADGYITSVQEGGLGGKTVWMRVSDRNISLYYAHLDKQLVEAGQRVKKGDTLGLVGNTGNARFTPSHLHFGIYNYHGAVDPWPFVNQTIKKAGEVKPKELDTYLQWKKPKTKASHDELLIPLAITNKNYIAELADGKIIAAPFDAVKQIKINGRSGEVVSETQSSSTGG
ncbi:MAG TPA: M23 family metallopeptidase [Chitinophagaceae bacterium]|nr:M23 family metallopeptidase [Chitinophagaceae bacterium]